MPRPRRSLIDQLLAVYREMDPQERPLAAAAIRGFDAAVATPKAKPAEQEQFEELGAVAAE